MPRAARIKGPECTYHIIIRGNNRQPIFDDDSDRIRYLNTIKKFKIKYNFLLYAYTLMCNHIHLIINSNGEDISKIMQSITISYTYYFNKKYGRTGHLFQDRFKSKVIDKDSYIVNLSKYIHNNPVKAGIVKKAYDYEWSSCKACIWECKDEYGIVDSEFVLGYFSNKLSKARELYIQYLLNNSEENCIKDKDDHSEVIKTSQQTHSLRNFSKTDINELLTAVSRLYNLPVADLMLRNNRRHSNVRNECFYIIRLKSKESIRNIAKVFGGICASSVSHGIGKAIDRMMSDEATFTRITKILNSIA